MAIDDSAEIAFVDSAALRLSPMGDHVRANVEMVVLNAAAPVAAQMARVLAERADVKSIHVMTHGAPGRMRFESGDWSAENLEEMADDLGVIGRALRTKGEINLWSCQVGAGELGSRFVACLAHLTGAGVSAASGLVGAPSLGGSWELDVRGGNECQPPLSPRPPFTNAGVRSFAGLLTAFTSAGPVEPIYVGGKWPVGTKAGKYFVACNRDATLEELGSFIVPVDMAGTFALPLFLPAGNYVLGAVGAPGTIGVYSGKYSPNGPGDGWSIGPPDAGLTAGLKMMTAPRRTVSVSL